MTNSPPRMPVCFAALLTALFTGGGLGGCDGGQTGPPDLPEPGQTPVMISEPVQGESPPAGSTGAAGRAMAASVMVTSAYVSYAPGSIPGADSILVTNISGGAVVGARMVDGGLDPIALPAAIGDTLVLEIFSAAVLIASDRAEVPEKDPPKVVRTSPRRRQTRVPLNASIQIVFSEPVSPPSIDAETIQLLNGTQGVPVTIGLSADGLLVELVPVEPLQAGATHVVVVTTGVLDRSGAPAEEEYTSDFTTSFEAGSGALSVQTQTSNNLDPDGFVLLIDGTTHGVLLPNGTVTLGPVTAGDRQIELADIAPNCQVDSQNPLTASVTEGAATTLDFAVSCTDPPEGRILFYQSGASSAWISVMNADGSGKIELRAIGSPGETGRVAASPDGSRIAFADANDEGGLEIYLMDKDGSDVRPMRPGGDADRFERFPSWGPGDGRIVYEAPDGIWRTDPLGDREQLVSASWLPGMPDWSPGGEALVWASAQFGILMYQPDLSRPIQVLHEGENVCGGNPCRDDLPIWSPDGSRILFRRIGIEPDYPGGLWVWNYEPKTEALLVENASWFDWSPDGSRIVYVDPEGIVVMNADGSDPVRIRSLADHFDADGEAEYYGVSWTR